MRVKEWESWLKTQLLKNWDHSIQSHYFTANRSGKSESSEIFFPKITVDGDCRHEIKRRLLFGRRASTNLDSMLKSRPTKVCIVKTMVFPVVMYRCEGGAIKEGWALKIWCFGIVVLWAVEKSNQSVLKEINPEYSLEGLMLSWSSNNLTPWCKEPIHGRRSWCWERLKAKEGSGRGSDV